MEGELRVYKPSREPLGTLWPVKGLSLAWNRNQVDAATFQLPYLSPRWSTAFINHYNIVEFHSDDLPEAWSGPIVSRKHSIDGGVSCLSMMHLLRKRYTDDWWQFVGTGGAITQALHSEASKRGPLQIEMGAVDRSGPEYYVEYEGEEIFKALSDLAAMTNGDFWVEKVGHSHQDPHLLRWARTRGQYLWGQVLISAEVIQDPELEESAPDLITAARVYGVEVDGERLRHYIPHPARNQYGHMEGRLDFPEIIDPTLLYEAGARALERRSRIIKLMGLNIDDRRGMWGQFWMGDTIRSVLYGQGFDGYDGPVRVHGIQVNGDTDEMGLVIEVPL